MSPDWFDTVLPCVHGWLQAANTPGAAVASIEVGRPARAACFGMLDLQSHTPVGPNAIFEAASLSKPLFAYGVLILASEGKLDLDAPLCSLSTEELIPGEERLARLTARQILSHSSGLPNWLDRKSVV
jgi:CubicO group peptidase (beta-lactamase class C family)